MPKLTKSYVDALKPREKGDYFEWDGSLPGFGVRVWTSGRKVYVVQYRTAGKTRRINVGPHGVFATEEARKKAKQILGDVARGSDPQEERRTRRTSITLADLCDRYLEAAEKGLIFGKGRRPKQVSTVGTDRGRIHRHIKPLLGKRLVVDLTPADIAQFIRAVASGHTATVEKTAKKRGKSVVTGGAGTAARTAGLLGGILSYAVSEGIITSNPAIGVKRPASVEKDRRLSANEFRALGEALNAASAAGETWQAIAAIRLLALTGCRKGEILSLRWSSVDFSNSCLRLSKTKEGKSVRPIGSPARKLLSELPRIEGCPFVLPGIRSAAHFDGLARAWKKIMALSELEDVTPHTLRHSFGSVAGDKGFNEATIAVLLGHRTGSVTSRYVHLLDSGPLHAADGVSSEISQMMNGEAAAVDHHEA